MQEKQKCPHCGEEINLGARKCRFCFSFINQPSAAVPPANQPTASPPSPHSNKTLYIVLICTGLLIAGGFVFNAYRYDIERAFHEYQENRRRVKAGTEYLAEAERVYPNALARKAQWDARFTKVNLDELDNFSRNRITAANLAVSTRDANVNQSFAYARKDLREGSGAFYAVRLLETALDEAARALVEVEAGQLTTKLCALLDTYIANVRYSIDRPFTMILTSDYGNEALVACVPGVLAIDDKAFSEQLDKFFEDNGFLLARPQPRNSSAEKDPILSFTYTCNGEARTRYILREKMNLPDLAEHANRFIVAHYKIQNTLKANLVKFFYKTSDVDFVIGNFDARGDLGLVTFFRRLGIFDYKDITFDSLRLDRPYMASEHDGLSVSRTAFNQNSEYQKGIELALAREAAKAEQARIEAERKAEAARLAAERKAEEERLAAERKAEAERLAAERKAQAEKAAEEKRQAQLEQELKAANTEHFITVIADIGDVYQYHYIDAYYTTKNAKGLRINPSIQLNFRLTCASEAYDKRVMAMLQEMGFARATAQKSGFVYINVPTAKNQYVLYGISDKKIDKAKIERAFSGNPYNGVARQYPVTRLNLLDARGNRYSGSICAFKLQLLKYADGAFTLWHPGSYPSGNYYLVYEFQGEVQLPNSITLSPVSCGTVVGSTHIPDSGSSRIGKKIVAW